MGITRRGILGAMLATLASPTPGLCDAKANRWTWSMPPRLPPGSTSPPSMTLSYWVMRPGGRWEHETKLVKLRPPPASAGESYPVSIPVGLQADGTRVEEVQVQLGWPHG